MSNDRYEKIRKALEMGPTPGPWKIGDQNGHCGISIGSDDDLVATVYLRLITSRARWGEEHFAMPENQEAVANASLIAACDPDTIRELLTERDALGAENARLREAMLDERDALLDECDALVAENARLRQALEGLYFIVAALRERLDEGAKP